MVHRKETLLEHFELVGLDVGAGNAEKLATDSSEDWLRAVVPGGVHESLLAAGRIEHPFYGDNERKAAWVDDREWWFRAAFDAPAHREGQHVRLDFDGLDTVTDLWLNGHLLGHQENQFRPAEFEITDLLLPRNTLLLRFGPPLLGREVPESLAETILGIMMAYADLIPEEMDPDDGGGMLDSLPFASTLRKAAFSWGWDFGPDIPSIGIWRPVRLSVDAGARITGHHVALTSLSDDRSEAKVRLLVEAEAGSDLQLTARVQLTAPSGRTFVRELTFDKHGAARDEFVIADPELWWTHDLGQARLHAVTIELRCGSDVLDRLDDRVGLRTIELNQRDDKEEGGRLFQFVLNGLPLFARGANWVPASMFVGSVSAERHYELVRMARDGNFTMLRVWGGGIYEKDSFYAACDQLGILLWHDFMFTSLGYPSADPSLQEEVRREAEYQVKRLRNRASMALWSGNNEVQLMQISAGGDLEEGDWGWHFFNAILPNAVAIYDGFVPYWPGSPYGEGSLEAVTGPSDGDRHNWEVWHGPIAAGPEAAALRYPTVGDSRHYRLYAKDMGKFISEFGIHASPELSTLRRWIPSSDLEVHSRVFDLHNKDSPKNKADELLAVTTGLPATLEQYVEYTQTLQAEAITFGVEHYRRRQPHTAGALIWQFNDVWPGFSWSLIDFDGIPKAAYFAAARAFSPVAVSFKDLDDGGLELWLNNNTSGRVHLDIDVELGDFSGSDRQRTRVVAEADPGTAASVWRVGPDAVHRDAHHYAWASSDSDSFPPARKHFAEIGQLQFGPNSLHVEPISNGIRVASTGYSYFVRIEQPVPGMVLSDNCFDLRDGESRDVTIVGADPASLTIAAFQGQQRQA